MVKENLGNERQFERAIVEDDSYIGEIKEFSDVYETTNLKGKDIEKLCIEIEIDHEKEGKIILPMFVTAVVSDAGEVSQKHRNSKVYDLLVEGKQLDNYMKMRDTIFKEGLTKEESNKLFVDFLRKILKGRKVKVLTKTVTPSKGDNYSVIADVMKFI